MPAGWTLDLEYVLASGAKLEWDWATDNGRPAYFQAVHIAGGKPVILLTESGNASTGQRLTPQSGRYDLTWENKGFGNFTVHFQVAEGYLQRMWPPGEGPACPPPVLLNAPRRMC